MLVFKYEYADLLNNDTQSSQRLSLTSERDSLLVL